MAEHAAAPSPEIAAREACAGAPSALATVDGPAAFVVGWLVFALVNVVAVDVVLPFPRTIQVRLVHHLFGISQALAVGACVCALRTAWERWAPRSRILAISLLIAVVVMPGGVLLHRDLRGLAAALPGTKFWDVALGPLLASVVLWALYAGQLAARFRLRLVAVGVAVVALGANSAVLRSGYYSLHLTVAFAGASLASAALVGATIPVWLAGVATRLAVVLRWPGVMALLVLGFPTFVSARSDVTVEMLRVRGEAFAPYIANIRVSLRPPKRWPMRTGTWFVDRREASPIEPSEPPLVGSAPIVVLVTVDALRAEVVNDERFAERFPTIHGLRKRSVAFVNARSTASQTTPSLTSLMTGRTYSMVYWTEKRLGHRPDVWPIHEGAKRFPELLSEAGVITSEVTGDTGFAAPSVRVLVGFDEHIVKPEWHAKEIVDGLIAQARAAGPKPAFIYSHLMEPHYPYDPPGKTSFDRYLGEVATVDAELARLVAALAAPELASRAVLILSADHGEAFGEHGTELHSVSVYDELIHVPLLVAAPGVAPRVVDDKVSLLDLGPTILDLFDHETPGAFMGQSLVPYLRGESPHLDRPIVADSGRRQQTMVFDDGYKVIFDLRHGTTELYDLAHDPKELDNLADARSDVARAHAAVLGAYFARHTLQRKGYVVPYRQ